MAQFVWINHLEAKVYLKKYSTIH